FSRDWSSDVCSSDLTARKDQRTLRRHKGLCNVRKLLIGGLGTFDRFIRSVFGEFFCGGISKIVGHHDDDGFLPIGGHVKRPGQRSEERRVGKEWRTR